MKELLKDQNLNKNQTWTHFACVLFLETKKERWKVNLKKKFQSHEPKTFYAI